MPAPEPKDYQRVTEYLTFGELAGLLRRSLKYLFRALPKIRILRQTPPETPLISVIIPTYNGNVLRIDGVQIPIDILEEGVCQQTFGRAKPLSGANPKKSLVSIK